jgi:hypothetical protein
MLIYSNVKRPKHFSSNLDVQERVLKMHQDDSIHKSHYKLLYGNQIRIPEPHWQLK